MGIVRHSLNQPKGETIKIIFKHPSSSIRLDKILTTIGSHVILIFFTVIIVYPVLWMALSSFKSPTEIVVNVWGFPRIIQWANYTNAWIMANIGSALFNSIIVSLFTLILVICFSAVAAYALARFSSRWLTVILLIFVFTMQTPTPIIPLYVELSKLHLSNSLAGLVLAEAAGGLPLAIFIFRAYFQSIPVELHDAAKVDGCNDLEAFFRVVIPISGPAIATVSILQVVGSWNEFLLPLLLVHNQEMYTIPQAIQTFFYRYGHSYWAYAFAALCIATIPIIIIYLALARQFIQGLTTGALKG